MQPLTVASFGTTPEGLPGKVYTLQNSQLRVRITDYGGRIVSIEAPDRQGRREHVVLGFEDVGAYALASGAFGALLGRTANRIAGGRFTLDGHTYELLKNEGANTLHGGPKGFDHVLWKIESSSTVSSPSVSCTYVSPEGDQGFPGELTVRASYRLVDDWLWLELEAHTTAPTLVSLSAHPYFNLSGLAAPDVLDHVVTVGASRYLPTDAHQIPTGELRSVASSPFDFRDPAVLGRRIRIADPQLIYGHGYDHYYVLDHPSGRDPVLAARAYSSASGRMLEVHTNQPGLQLYSGNQLNGSVAGRGGIYRQSAGLAFEPQGYPDAIHHAHFISNVLRPSQSYAALIGYRFGIADATDTLFNTN